MTIQAEWTPGGNLFVRQYRAGVVHTITIERADIPKLIDLLFGCARGNSPEESVPVEDVWLRYEGAENDPLARVTVSVSIAGREIEIINEAHGACFSHCITAAGIREAFSK